MREHILDEISQEARDGSARPPHSSSQGGEWIFLLLKAFQLTSTLGFRASGTILRDGSPANGSRNDIFLG
jgi:hypothetical protein